MPVATLDPGDLVRREVAVGHLDTGVDVAHPALAGKVHGFLYVDEAGVPRPERAGFDTGTHGTHTAGILTAAAPDARLYCAAVIEGGKTPVRILVGLEWLLEQPIRILHLPLGVRADTPFLAGVLAAFRARGVLTVAAVGNGGSSKHQSPGGYDGVLSVGACADDGSVPRFSGSRYAPDRERCDKPDVLARGVDILSAAPGGGWLRDSGTSMACAHVAGVAASLWREHPEASVDAVEAAIVHTATPLPEAWRHRCRAGIVDPEAALAYLREGRHAGAPPRPAQRPMVRFVDPRLTRKLMFGCDDAELEALVVHRAEAPAGGSEGDQALERLVDGCARAVGSRPAVVRSLHGGAICVVRGEMRLLAALFAHPSIVVAQATEVDSV